MQIEEISVKESITNDLLNNKKDMKTIKLKIKTSVWKLLKIS